jgi:hypothetical protein
MARVTLFSEDDWYRAMSNFLNSPKGQQLLQKAVKKHVFDAFDDIHFEIPQDMVTRGLYTVISSWNSGSEYVCACINEMVAERGTKKVTPQMVREAISLWEKKKQSP